LAWLGPVVRTAAMAAEHFVRAPDRRNGVAGRVPVNRHWPGRSCLRHAFPGRWWRSSTRRPGT